MGMGSYTDNAKAFLDGEMDKEEWIGAMIQDLAVSSPEQLKKLAEAISKIPA